MAVLGIEHAQLATPPGQEAKARSFYVDVLGLLEIAKPPRLAARGGCWFEGGQAKIHLGVEGPSQPARKAHVALLVDDLDAVIARAGAAGWEVEKTEGLGDRRQAYNFDLFGDRLEMLTPAPFEGRGRAASAGHLNE